MEKIGIRGTEKEEESKAATFLLKALLDRELTQSGGAKRRTLHSKEMLFGPERWGTRLEDIGKGEALHGYMLVDELSEVKKQVDDLNLEVESVKWELKQCKEGISMILNELREKPITKQTELFELDKTLEVIKPIPVVIEEYNDEVIATFPEIETFGVGSGEAEAIRNLKQEIRKIFFELENISDDKLGKVPISWKRVLLKVVKNIGDVK